MQIAEALYFAKDELERNYACSEGGGIEARRQNILAMPTAIPRVGELTLLKLATTFPNATGRMLGNQIEGTGLQYIGGGSENTTITDGATVTKIYRKSVRWSESDRQAKVEQMTEQHLQLRGYLGSFAVPQVVTVDYHPLRPGQRAVLTSQAHYDFEDTGIFNPYSPGIDASQ